MSNSSGRERIENPTLKGPVAAVAMAIVDVCDTLTCATRSSSATSTASILDKEARAAVRHMAKAASESTPALWMASLRGQTEKVRQLLRGGADIEDSSMKSMSPLHAAVYNGHEGAVRVLLQHGADVSAKDAAGRTALHVSARRGQQKVLLLLLEHGGADASAEDVLGNTPLFIATLHGHTQVVRVFLEHEALSLPLPLSPSSEAGVSAKGESLQWAKRLAS